MSRLLRFSVATCLWLCWLVAPNTTSQSNASAEEVEAATVRRDNVFDAIDWALLDKMFASEDLSASSDAALPDSSFDALRLVPEMVVTNLVEMLKFLKHLNEDCFQACQNLRDMNKTYSTRYMTCSLLAFCFNTLEFGLVIDIKLIPNR